MPGALFIFNLLIIFVIIKKIYKDKYINMITFLKNQLNKKTCKFVIMFLCFMVLAYICGFIYSNIKSVFPISFESFFNSAFTITDAENYLKIAEQGYVTEGNDKYTLVFFPMFPLMIRILHTITFLDYQICSFIISLVSSCISVVLLYKIVKIDYTDEVAEKATFTYILYPVISFLATGLNEGVFMMLLLASIYFLRKKKYLLAGLFGYMVALTRLPGLCVGVIMLVETIMYIYKSGKNNKFRLKVLLKQAVMMLMTLLGLCTYLLINYFLYNDFFKFFDFQEEIWFQTVKNPIYVIFNIIINSQIRMDIIEIGFSNLIACILILASVLYAIYRKVRVSYILYMLVYFWVCYSASWLLSGARYSIAAFVIFISAGIFFTLHKRISKVFYVLYFFIFIYVSCLCTNSVIY